MIKYIFTALISALVFSTPLIAATQDSLIETISQHRDSIVTVRAFRPIADQHQSASLSSQGAGVIIDPNGLVITNLHTIKLADKVAVIHKDRRIRTKIVDLWPQHDLALLKIFAPYPLKAIQIADSDTLRLKDEIINIGTSYYRKNTLTGGRVTGLGRSHTANTLEIIQVNLDLYEGDSGGPLLNRRGELIGMLTAKHLQRDNTAFAVPSNKIKNLYLKSLK